MDKFKFIAIMRIVCFSFVLSIPTLIMYLNHWNKTFFWVWFFNLIIFYILLWIVYED